MPAPEHDHGAHGHGTGYRWLDIIVTVSAVFISVVSLAVSIEHGHTMEKMVDQNEKMVEASTMPILKYMGSQFTPEGKPLERLILSNQGNGPAIIDRFEIRYKGVSYVNPGSLLRACCAAALQTKNGIVSTGIIYSNVSGNILSPQQQTTFIQIDPSQAGNDLVEAFEKGREDLEVHACYCSVLGKCWETNLDNKRPKPVNACTVKDGEKLW